MLGYLEDEIAPLCFAPLLPTATHILRNDVI